MNVDRLAVLACERLQRLCGGKPSATLLQDGEPSPSPAAVLLSPLDAMDAQRLAKKRGRGQGSPYLRKATKQLAWSVLLLEMFPTMLKEEQAAEESHVQGEQGSRHAR